MLEILNKKLEKLELSNKLLNTLKEKGITTIEDIWKLKRNDLKTLKLTNKEINEISTKLQLKGLDLNKKIY